jgi:hypothetical protein
MGGEDVTDGKDRGVDIQWQMWKDRSCSSSSYNPPRGGRPHKRIPHLKGGSMRIRRYSSSRPASVSTASARVLLPLHPISLSHHTLAFTHGSLWSGVM